MKIFQLIDMIIRLFRLNKKSKVVLLFLIPTFLVGQNNAAFWLGKRPSGAAPTNLLLDDYPGAAAAYSLRKLDKDYGGFAVEVRRSNDGNTQNIGFSNGDFDTASLNSFCSGTSCTVRTWYDQSGNGRDAVQTTVANQPLIYASGSVVLENTKPAMDFDGSNDFFTNSAPQFTTHTIISVSLTDTETLSIIAGTNSNVPFGSTFGYISSTDFRIQNETPTVVIANNVDFEGVFYAYNNGSSSLIYANQILKTSASQTGTFDYNIIGGRQSQSPLYFNGTQQELILYPSAKSLPAEITNIHSNINSYYSIY
jgi:hypothetical protein